MAGTVVDGLFFACEGVEVSADAFDVCDYLARAASLCAFECEVLGEVGDAAFAFKLMSGSAAYGYAAVYGICRAGCAYEAHSIT